MQIKDLIGRKVYWYDPEGYSDGYYTIVGIGNAEEDEEVTEYDVILIYDGVSEAEVTIDELELELNYQVFFNDGVSQYNCLEVFKSKDEAIAYANGRYSEKEPVNPRDTADVVNSARTAQFEVVQCDTQDSDDEDSEPEVVYMTGYFYNE